MFCAKCGKQIPDGSAVCPFCGAPMAAPQAPQAAPVAPQAPHAVPPVAPVYAPVAPKEKKPVNKLPIIIGAIAAAAVLAIVLYLILHDGAKAVVKDYLNYAEKAEKESSEFMMTTSKKALKALDLDEDDDDDDEEDSWSVKGSKSYSGKDDAFEGLCTYIEKTRVKPRRFPRCPLSKLRLSPATRSRIPTVCSSPALRLAATGTS